MSNWKRAYGWSGHILISEEEDGTNLDDNVVAVPEATLERIEADMDSIGLDERIEAHQLGVEDSDCTVLAVGTCFSEGFGWFGTVFLEAELRGMPGPPAIDHDGEYLTAMKEIYGLELPPCRLMVGCSVETE